MTDSGLSRSASAFGPFHDVAFLRLLFLFESSCIIVFIGAERDKSRPYAVRKMYTALRRLHKCHVK